MDSLKHSLPFSYCCLFLCSMLVGCFGGGQASLPELAQGTGTVTLDGKPLEGATVTFNPKQGGASFASTDQSGKFTLMFNQETQGVIPGNHVVKIVKEQDVDIPGTNLVPEKYNNNSTLTADVKLDGPNEFKFDLTTK